MQDSSEQERKKYENLGIEENNTGMIVSGRGQRTLRRRINTRNGEREESMIQFEEGDSTGKIAC